MVICKDPQLWKQSLIAIRLYILRAFRAPGRATDFIFTRPIWKDPIAQCAPSVVRWYRGINSLIITRKSEEHRYEVWNTSKRTHWALKKETDSFWGREDMGRIWIVVNKLCHSNTERSMLKKISDLNEVWDKYGLYKYLVNCKQHVTGLNFPTIFGWKA